MEVKIQTRKTKKKKKTDSGRQDFFLLQHFSQLALILALQIVKVWSEDGAGKVVEIPADMTARDVCQLLVYKSHCVDDSAWTLVEHHPILGLGEFGGTSTQVGGPFSTSRRFKVPHHGVLTAKKLRLSKKK